MGEFLVSWGCLRVGGSIVRDCILRVSDSARVSASVKGYPCFVE